MIQEAIEFHLDGIREEGLTIPAPSSFAGVVEIDPAARRCGVKTWRISWLDDRPRSNGRGVPSQRTPCRLGPVPETPPSKIFWAAKYERDYAL